MPAKTTTGTRCEIPWALYGAFVVKDLILAPLFFCFCSLQRGSVCVRSPRAFMGAA